MKSLCVILNTFRVYLNIGIFILAFASLLVLLLLAGCDDYEPDQYNCEEIVQPLDAEELRAIEFAKWCKI